MDAEMSVETFKIIALVAILITRLAGGLLSRILSAGKKSELVFTMGNAFAGGVFLGAGVIHMLPDAREGFEALLGEVDYPWFALVCAVGFLLILFLEKVCFPHDHKDGPSVDALPGKKVLYPYVLLLILSIHSIITGIALGTESRIVQAAIILIAVLAHKGTASFALGVSMLRTSLSPSRFTRLIVFFSCTTPIGILLGIWVMSVVTGRTAQAFEAIFDGLAAGTFLYVAVVDIIEVEFSHHQSQWLKFGLVALGLGVMAIVAIWT
jgi:zinc transporter 1/2/3